MTSFLYLFLQGEMKPIRRAYHLATVVYDRMYIIGGFENDGHEVLYARYIAFISVHLKEVLNLKSNFAHFFRQQFLGIFGTSTHRRWIGSNL